MQKTFNTIIACSALLMCTVLPVVMGYGLSSKYRKYEDQIEALQIRLRYASEQVEYNNEILSALLDHQNLSLIWYPERISVVERGANQ